MISRRELLKQIGVLAGSFFVGQVPSPGLMRKQSTANSPLLLAHYMPWYQAPSVSGFWGWHWTMDHFDPNQMDENGHPEIASHFSPLTGPYDSSDDAILEYQVLLLKLSGIDGVIVDWYGIEDFRDYAAVNRSTLKLFEYIKRAGLHFAICYEDQSLKHMIDENVLEAGDAISKGQAVMRFMETNWFTQDGYLKYGEQPVLLTFGPQYFKSSRDWEKLFSVLAIPAALITLDKHMVSNALGSFPWAPMYGYIVPQEVLEAYLIQFYRKAKRWDYLVAGAFPGFYDIYAEAGVRASYGFLDAQQGETFRYILQTALDQAADVIQLITWNDYGEGTIIEPTEEFGYQYLEMVQETQRTLRSDFSFTSEDLRLPMQLFNLRKSNPTDSDLNQQLDAAFNAIITGDVAAATKIIADK